jgi:hypothetical protein
VLENLTHITSMREREREIENRGENERAKERKTQP